jgi:hypothetical protein
LDSAVTEEEEEEEEKGKFINKPSLLRTYIRCSHVLLKYRQYSLLQHGDNTDQQEQWKTCKFVPINVTKAYRGK